MAQPRIVVVEDESIVADHLVVTLSQLGYDAPEPVATGEEALTLVEKVKPDLVLMDIKLSGKLDGIETARLIRDQWGIPVVYITVYAQDPLLQRAVATEPFGYLLKPFRKESLRTSIEVALYKSKVDGRLRESEEKYRDLVELLPQYIFETDLDGNLVYLNRPGMEAFGITPSDLSASLKITKIVFREDRDKAEEALRTVLAGRRVAELELRLRTRDGGTVPVVSYADPVAEKGRVVGMRGVVVDISDRKRAEEALQDAHDHLERKVDERTADLADANQRLRLEIIQRERAQEEAQKSYELFRAVFESARDCIFVKDSELRYTLVNPEMVSLLGRPSLSVIGLTDEALFGTDAGNHLNEVDARVLQGETIEEEHSRPVAGEYLTFHDVRVPIRDHSGSVVGICGISRNVTERKRARRAGQADTKEYVSQAMLDTLKKAQSVAATDSTVLLLGESGSGKDHLARWIHDHSSRSNSPFFAVNCAALSHELAESELFGHEAGAFTGARGRVRGLLELAEGGTLLLNEIGELSLTLQAKLLSFLDTRCFNRVGGRESIKVNARLIAATNRDLRSSVSDGSFRSDLYYRLNVFTLTVPPLRKRPGDIPPLVEHLVGQLVRDLGLPSVPAVPPETMDKLCSYHWPGNIRELRNLLERALILSEGSVLHVDMVPHAEKADDEVRWTVAFPPDQPLPLFIEAVRRNFVNEALRRSGGNKEHAARMLQISRYTLRRQMKGLGLDVPK